MRARVTLRDVAAQAGVHHATASRALKDDPRVQPETLAKIKAIAAKMGYMPDPMLSALNAYRHAARASQYHGTVAWITNYATRDGWRASECYRFYFEGAAAQLKLHGYNLEEYWLQESGLTARRASQVLLHRGIRGLLICPLPISRGHLSLDWDKFAAVSFGYSLVRPKLHLFSASHYRAIVNGMRQLRARGYQRVGMVTSHEMNERMDRMWTAAHHAELPMFPQSKDIPIHVYSDQMLSRSRAASQKEPKKLFLKWYRTHKPDAIITSSAPVAHWLMEEGFSVPEDVAAVSATLQEGEKLMTGTVEPSREIGRGAANFLVGMLQRGEHGVPAYPQRVLFEGTWFNGKTLGERSRPKKQARPRRLKPVP